MNSNRFCPGALSRNDLNISFGYLEGLGKEINKGFIGLALDRGRGDFNLKKPTLFTYDLVS